MRKQGISSTNYIRTCNIKQKFRAAHRNSIFLTELSVKLSNKLGINVDASLVNKLTDRQSRQVLNLAGTSFEPYLTLNSQDIKKASKEKDFSAILVTNNKNGPLIGYLLAHIYPDSPRFYYIASMAVKNTFRNKKIAHDMLSSITNIANKTDYLGLMLLCEPQDIYGNQLTAFYERAGFSVTGVVNTEYRMTKMFCLDERA